MGNIARKVQKLRFPAQSCAELYTVCKIILIILQFEDPVQTLWYYNGLYIMMQPKHNCIVISTRHWVISWLCSQSCSVHHLQQHQCSWDQQKRLDVVIASSINSLSFTPPSPVVMLKSTSFPSWMYLGISCHKWTKCLPNPFLRAACCKVYAFSPSWSAGSFVSTEACFPNHQVSCQWRNCRT